MDDIVKAKLELLTARQKRFSEQFQAIRIWLDGLSEEVYSLRQHHEEANLQTLTKETN